MVSFWKQVHNNQPTHPNIMFTGGFQANYLRHWFALQRTSVKCEEEKETKGELMKVSTRTRHHEMIVIGIEIELIYILMQTQRRTISVPICCWQSLIRSQTKSNDSIQGEQNNPRVLKQITFNWCLHQTSGDRLPGSSPLCDEGKRIHFFLGEWEINDHKMDLGEMRYELCLGGLARAQIDSWVTGVNWRGRLTGLKV